ncbi:DUF418 domain-containing protein [Parapedobacter koreensis]|uniref:DUF418 domain-containing protein n=1 Tax=Parapedobacter koreensis TaxID=332977 RepID=A0A1H7NXR2_9SPHI|nr:DUF418 domain-containing protein [Parapedobacter koreensis]SEL28331.1 uncharacterized protein SAMN05421740_104139 [Parapedobacter koreensis]
MNHILNRLQIVDMIRGLALLGILIFNIQTYALFAFLRPEQVYVLGLDAPSTYLPVQLLIQLFVRGQFYTLYSFLFGFGFYMIMNRNLARGWEGQRIFRRRMWILLLFGVIHATVFWFGDILHKYAILGFTLPYFYAKSPRQIINWIGGIAGATILISIVRTVLFGSNEGNSQEMDAVIDQVVQTWQHGSFFDVLNMQKLGVAMLWFMDAQHGFTGLAHYEIMFLLGLLAGKGEVFLRIPELKGILRTWTFRLLLVAFLFKLVASAEVLRLHWLPDSLHHYETLIYSLSRFIGTPLLTIGYLMLFILLAGNSSSALARWIANAGRLGLTNYLMQTLLCMLLFYGYGVGLSGSLTLLEAVGVAFLIYIFQLVYSTIWLRYYEMGPMEGLWRRLTYPRKSV